MESDIEKKTETGPGTGETTSLHRLVIDKAADKALATIVERVNDGFNGGRVSRTQTVSWILVRQVERLSDTFIREIRADHFDEVALLEATLKQAKASGKISPELRAFLQKQMLGVDEDVVKKRSKKEVDELGTH